MSQPKAAWPELVGKTEAEAKAQILKDKPDANIQVLDEHSPATTDYSPNRVRIFLNKEGKVAGIPGLG